MFNLGKNCFCNHWGRSLIEQLLVVATIGIVAAVGVPEYSKFASKNRIKRAANDLVQEMRLTRTIAMLENREYLMIFDKDPDSNPGTNDDRYLIGFDGDGDKQLKTQGIDGYQNGPVKVINLSDYGPAVTFGTLSERRTNGDPVDNSYCKGKTACFGNTKPAREVFKPSGSVGFRGSVYFQDNPDKFNSRGFSYAVVVSNFSARINLWRWNGEKDKPPSSFPYWTELR